MKKSSKEKLRERMSENGKRSAAKRNKTYYKNLSQMGHDAQGRGKGSRPTSKAGNPLLLRLRAAKIAAK